MKHAGLAVLTGTLTVIGLNQLCIAGGLELSKCPNGVELTYGSQTKIESPSFKYIPVEIPQISFSNIPIKIPNNEIRRVKRSDKSVRILKIKID